MEEMQHANKLTVRIIFLDGMPNMQVLAPLGQTVKEILDCDLQSCFFWRSWITFLIITLGQVAK